MIVLAAACAVTPAPAPPPATRPATRPGVPSTPAGTQTNAADYSQFERDIMHLVNLERIRNRIDTLTWNAALERAARLQANEMAAERKMAHELPGAAYPTLKDRIRYSGYSYLRLAENIAYGYPTPATTVAAWMKSLGHRTNILDRASVETGVAVMRAKSGELYYCQVFGARLY